jgi:AbiV family abortive infection protein
MEPRALKRLLQLTAPKRLDAIAEGIALLVEHVGALTSDQTLLADAGRPRGGAVLEALAEEEAAKVLILLDLVCMRSGEGASPQVSWFYSHLARCIYADVAHMQPATFGEIRSMVNALRKSHYLDGPADVDWIFRNQLIARREEILYVDYVRDEDGERWTTPARYETAFFSGSTWVQELVTSLHRVGCTSRPGLEVVAAAWRDQNIEDDTRWVEVRAINRRVVEEVIEQGLVLPEATQEDASRVVDRWPFPLSALDLRELEVPLEALNAQRERWAYDEF